MKESIEQRRRFYVGKYYYRETYLKDLSRLLLRDVTETELLSIGETDAFLERFSKENLETHLKFTMGFDDKEQLRALLLQHITKWTVPYMMYLSNVENCGLIEIPTLYDFNWDFKYSDETHGSVYFKRKDYKEKILLDYYEEYNEYYLDLEIWK